ncbi:phage portal protein [Aneurinibacillus soli]|uniref:phage portal protein n=1 Tax=Aneurinibacillus soli TaxID=1500254 RepID=UPI0021ABA14D|nr:phage portal protein [Aneurinibacillus soli]
MIRNKATQVDENFSKWFRGGRSIFLSGNNSKLASNETIFAAVSRLSNSMATLPLKFFKEFSPVYTELSDLISNSPNNNMTSFDFIRILETHRNVHGNGYALKMYGRHYSVTSLVILDPTCVEPVVEQETGELWYEINGEKGRYYVHNLDMIHIKHIHTTQNGYKGISPIDVLRNTIDFDREVREFSLSQMEGGIHASFILKYAAHIGKEKKAEILENFKSFYKDNGGVLIQESGVEIDPITRNFIDTKVFEVEKITRTRVATVFNMPVSMLGETDGASYSSMEQMSLEFVTYTLLPIVRQYEQEFNRKLLTPQERQRGLYFKFNLSALLRGDTSTRGEFYFKMVRSGVFKPNEIRAWEELPPEVGGEKLYISGDLYPIDTPPSERKGVKASEQEVLGI